MTDLNHIVNENQDWLEKLALVLVKNDQTRAEDLVQETWRKVIEKRPNLNGSARPWLSTTLRNLAIENQRKRQTRNKHKDSLKRERQARTNHHSPDRLQTIQELQEIISELPPTYQEFISLHFGDGLSCVEIARKLGVSHYTIRKRKMRALSRLRVRLKNGYGHEISTWSILILWKKNSKSESFENSTLSKFFLHQLDPFKIQCNYSLCSVQGHPNHQCN